MASAGGYTKIAVSCAGGSFYGNSNPFPRWSSIYNQTSSISNVIANFLVKHGVNAVSEPPLPHGVAAGGMGMIITTGKIVLQLHRINKLIQSFREKQAYTQRRELVPNIVVRLEILQESRNSTFSTKEDLISAQQLIALIKELTDFLKFEYPLLRIEYLIISPKGSSSCFSVYIPDVLVTNLNLMKVINGLSKDKGKQFCTVKLERKFWVFSKVLITDKTHRGNTLFNCHHRDCTAPQWEYLAP